MTLTKLLLCLHDLKGLALDQKAQSMIVMYILA